MTEDTTTNGAAQAPSEPGWVPERVQKLTAQRNDALERITNLEREVERLTPLADRADAWKQKAEGLTSELENHQAKWTTDRALLEAGITDGEVRELFQWQYDRLGGEEKPAFGEWLQEMHTEGAEVPSVLRAYVTPPPAPGAAEPAVADAAEAAPPPTAEPTQATPQISMPHANANTRPAPIPRADPSAGDISQMDQASYDAWYQEQATKNGWTLPDRLRKS